MDSVGVISLVINVSKDLYTYYRAIRDCDTDIKELRTQLLLLHETASSLTRALSREGRDREASFAEPEDARGRGQSKEGNGYRGEFDVPSDERPRVADPCCRRFDLRRPVHW